MSNETNNIPEDALANASEAIEYTATFTMTQHGEDGDFVTALKFTPEPDPDNPALVHVLMHAVASDFLRKMDVMDDEGNLMVEETGTPGLVRAIDGTTKH